ncbi:hypothetical protein ABTY59_28790 [Streptomyces sp. NPDC096079]|uniref:hypothetical protein n=1 Tax=unclassified Streptomyces TaxID=2593676 RepID=UPI0033243844
MPVDPYAVLQALLRAEAARGRRTDRTASEPAAPAPAPQRPARREDRPRREDPLA